MNLSEPQKKVIKAMREGCLIEVNTFNEDYRPRLTNCGNHFGYLFHRTINSLSDAGILKYTGKSHGCLFFSLTPKGKQIEI